MTLKRHERPRPGLGIELEAMSVDTPVVFAGGSGVAASKAAPLAEHNIDVRCETATKAALASTHLVVKLPNGKVMSGLNSYGHSNQSRAMSNNSIKRNY